MLVPMSPTSSLFLLAETREHPMHVGGLELFRPPEGATGQDLTELLDRAMASAEVAPIFAKRARRGITSLGQWAWEADAHFDLEHHVRRNALPAPARVRELLTLCSRLHSTMLDRHRPPWEMNLIEGLDGDRLGVYFKAHHALVDGVSALRLLSRMLSADPADLGMPPFWAPRPRIVEADRDEPGEPLSAGTVRDALSIAADVAGIAPALVRSVNRGLNEQGGSLSFSAPRSMLNVPVTAARRFAAQSWPMDRVRQIGKAAEATVNDVVLALCSGALRRYLVAMDALPETPLIAMVPVSLHGADRGHGDGSGNAVGAVMCNLATTLDDPAQRLAIICRSMLVGKDALRGMSQLQILAMTAIGISPLGIYPLLHLDGKARPPFNLIISNVPGPRRNMYWNGWRLDGLYPLSVVLDGQALNITVTSYSDEIAFGLTGCRRSVPHLQRLLGYLDDELAALEVAVGV
jgi:diacylglycerol O-acyltransferase / wax synthase